jgi:hypothetical protein
MTVFESPNFIELQIQFKIVYLTETSKLKKIKNLDTKQKNLALLPLRPQIIYFSIMTKFI